MRGCSVLTRPSIISGKPVTAATSVTLRPASLKAFEVPPVEISCDAVLGERLGEVDEPGFVRDRQQGAADGTHITDRHRFSSVDYERERRNSMLIGAPQSASARHFRPHLRRVAACFG